VGFANREIYFLAARVTAARTEALHNVVARNRARYALGGLSLRRVVLRGQSIFRATANQYEKSANQ
jgi:hypothetical protein